MASAKKTFHHFCTTVRTSLVTHSTLNLSTGERTEGASEWVTGACSAGLFSDAARASGVCSSCARGWTHPKNYRAGALAPTRELDADAAFFFTFAGFSHGPDETAEEGKTRCAEQAREHEAIYLRAHKLGLVSCEWERDPVGFSDYAADKKAGHLARGIGKPERIEVAGIVTRDTEGVPTFLASLGGIWDADDNYRRVVRAELAHECADELRALLAAHETPQA